MVSRFRKACAVAVRRVILQGKPVAGNWLRL